MGASLKSLITLKAVKVILCIVSWFAFSAGLSSVNKILFGEKYNDFKYPLLASSFHATLHFFLAHIFINFIAPKLFPRYHNKEMDKPGVVTFFEKDYWFKVAPCAIAGGLEISTCNAALMFVTLSFYTVIKSSVPIWVLIFSFILGLEKIRSQLILIIFIICVGVALASINGAQFNHWGFLLILVGSISSGLKWCLTQILLQKSDLGLDHPVLTLHKVAPLMGLFMLICSFIFEDLYALPSHLLTNTTPASSHHPSWLLIIIGGVLAFLMTLAEFSLIQLTSTLTMSITGISKEVMMIAISVLIFKDTLTGLNYFGLVVSIIGISWYNYYKLSQQTATSYEELNSTLEEESPVLPDPLLRTDGPNSNSNMA